MNQPLPNNTLRIYVERLDDEYRVTWALNGALHEAHFTAEAFETSEQLRHRIAGEIAREATAAIYDELNG